MALLEDLTHQLGGDALGSIAGQLDVDGAGARKAISAALPMLLGGIARNTRSGGAESLAGALDRDHDGGILDNVQGYLDSASALADDGILEHVFGDSRHLIEKALSGLSGIDAGSAGKLLQMLAPLVMGAVGKEKRRLDLDPGGLGDLLGFEAERAQANGGSGVMDLLGSVLDSDGDGSVTDELAGAGKKLLGSLLGRS